MALASDLVERLPRVWQLLGEGLIDFSRARVMVRGTAHLGDREARRVVEEVYERAPLLTTGELGALIRRLCVDVDPEQAEKRYENAVGERKLWVEQTPEGTGNVYLLDIPITDAQTIGRRVNGHMISLRNDGDGRSHDNAGRYRY